MDDAVRNEKRDPFDDALTKDGFHEFGNWICLSGPAHTVTNTWEPNRDVLSLKENKVGTTVVSAYGYSVNGIGQRTGLNQSGTAFSSARSIGWGYDAMGQVILNDSSIAGFDWAYLYDSIGNRTKASNVLPPPRRSNRAPQFNSLNELTGYVTETTGGNIPLLTTSHDDDGNATAYPLPVATTVNSTLAWDAENRLVSTTTNGVTTNNIYDCQSRRIAVTAGGITKVTVYDGWNPIADYVSGSLVRSYQWGQDLSGTLQGAGGVGGLLALSTGSQTYDPTYDGNGNVSEYLDGSGTVAAHFEYTPFGQTTVDTDSSGMFDIRFSTKRRDVETGLYYYGYRYYDPVTGRWPSRDPIDENGGVNLYSFILNNALSKIDYLGLCDCTGGAAKIKDDAGRKCCESDIQDIQLQIDMEGIGHAQLNLPGDGDNAHGFFPSTNIITPGGGKYLYGPHDYSPGDTRTFKACPESVEAVRNSINSNTNAVYSTSNIGGSNCAGWACNRLNNAGFGITGNLPFITPQSLSPNDNFNPPANVPPVLVPGWMGGY